MILLLQYTLVFASVLLLVALGGCFSERSGVINIGLEGIMVLGALGGALVLRFLPQEAGVLGMLSAALLASALMGVLGSAFLAVAAIAFRADQTITGTAINMLATAGATVGVKAMNSALSGGKDLLIAKIGSFDFNLFVLVALAALVLSFLYLYKTSGGLRLRACGEHPQAADSVGVNVNKMRYTGVLLSGVLGGIGGLVYITAGVSVWKFENGVSGFGFLAMAVMIFGHWHPLQIGLAAMLFGFFRALGNVYSGFDLLTRLELPSVVYNMLPYVIALGVLALSSKRSLAPKALGIPYDKGAR